MMRMMDQTCRHVPEPCHVSHVDVAILDGRVFDLHTKGINDECVYHASTIRIVDDGYHARVVVSDMHGNEMCACQLDQRVTKVRFLSCLFLIVARM